MNWKRIARIIRKEFVQALREPRMRVVLFLPPLVQLIIFGYAVNLDVERARIAWMDQDRTPASIELRYAFTGSGRFDVTAAPSSDREAQALLDRADVQAVVRVLPGFSRDIAAGRHAPVQILLDGTNSNTASIISGYASTIISRYTGEVLAERLQQRMMGPSMVSRRPMSLPAGGLNTRSRVWFNPDLRSRNYYVPGVIINIVTIVTLMLTAMAIVREKEIGTMEQLMVTPIRPIELMIGKMSPFAFVGLLDMMLVTVAALLIFGIQFRGAPLLLLCSSLLFVLSTLGAGLFLSTLCETQQQAMMAAFFFFMPAFALSGFAFPIRNMPLLVQWLTYLNPLRYFMQIVRDIFLKGTGLSVVWPQMIALAVFGVSILTLSALRFHKRLD